MMNKIGFATITLSVLMVLTASCTSREEKGENNRDGESYNDLAWRLREDGAPASEFIAMQQKAVEAVEAGESDDDPVEVMAQMGYFYNIAGDYSNGVDYLLRAVEIAKDREPSEGMITLYGDLGDLYVTLGLGEEALEANTKSLEMSCRLNGRYLSDVYRFRATIFDLLNMPDSVIGCLDRALYTIDNGNIEGDREVMRSTVLHEKADYIIMKNQSRDSVDKAVKTLEKLKASYGRWDISGMDFPLGLGYLAQGNSEKGIRLMEDAIAEFEKQDDMRAISDCLPSLMDAYARNGHYDQLGSKFLQYASLRDSLLNQEKLNAVAGADLRYRASQLKEANETLRLRHELTRQRIILWSAGALALLLGLGIYIRMQKLKHRRELEEQSKKMETLLAERIELNSHIENLNNQLNTSNSEMNQNASFLQPAILDKEHEKEFRQSFSALYPDFLPSLRKDFPELTPGNELVCMMIFLHKSTDEIALALGISRDSVNKTRYRLRQRFNLPREVELDAFLRSRR